MQPASQIEQILALTDRNVRAWAISRLSPDEDISDKTFGDFVSITLNDLTQFLMASPLQTDSFWESYSSREMPRQSVNGRMMVVPKKGRWMVYYSGNFRTPPDVETFGSRKEAIERAADKLWVSAMIHLNSAYCMKRQIFPVDSIGTASSALLR